jgi:hypothetical protein
MATRNARRHARGQRRSPFIHVKDLGDDMPGAVAIDQGVEVGVVGAERVKSKSAEIGFIENEERWRNCAMGPQDVCRPRDPIQPGL